jgi:hypothetical protein
LASFDLHHCQQPTPVGLAQAEHSFLDGMILELNHERIVP